MSRGLNLTALLIEGVRLALIKLAGVHLALVVAALLFGAFALR